MKGKGFLKAACIGYLATALFYILIASISLVLILQTSMSYFDYSFYSEAYKEGRILSLVVNSIDVVFFVCFAIFAILTAVQGLKDGNGNKKSSTALLVLTIVYPLVVVLTCTYGKSGINSFLSVVTFLASSAFVVFYLLGTNLLSSSEAKNEKPQENKVEKK